MAAVTLLFILLVIFFPVGIRLMFPQEKVSGWVRAAISKVEVEGVEGRDVKIEFDRAQTTVLGSISYPFGVRIKNLSVEIKKNCKLFKGKFGTVVLPFHFRKAVRKKIELGLVRLQDGSFEVSNFCEGTPLQKVQLESEKAVLKPKVVRSKKHFEEQLVKAFSSVATVDLSFLKTDSGDLRSKGLLVYDFSINVGEGKELLVDRFKVLFGKGDLLARGEWSSELILPEGVSGVTGEFQVSKNLVDIKARLKEKEGLLSINLSIPRRELGEDRNLLLGNLEMTVKDFPLSIISRFKKLKLAGLNLRKTWVNLNVKMGASLDKISVDVEELKAHGNFGSLELGRKGLGLLWGGGKAKWSQPEKAEFKLSEVILEEIISINPKKRVRGVFGEFGKFNAFLTFENLNSLNGDFETKDFSVLFRSMGKAAYQKAKRARGRLGYVIDEKLFFVLDEVDLVEGAFEGFIKLEYDFANKFLHTKFDIGHFRLNPQILKELFKIEIMEGFQVLGEGQSLRRAFTEEDKVKKRTSRGKLQFMLKSTEVKFSQWGLTDIAANCGLDESELKCSLSAEALSFSDKLSGAIKMTKKYHKNLRTQSFLYKNQKLEFDLGNKESKIYFDWTKSEGLGVYPKGYSGISIKTRSLD